MNRTKSSGSTAGESLKSRSNGDNKRSIAVGSVIDDIPRSRLSSRPDAPGALGVILPIQDWDTPTFTPLENMIPILVARYENISHIAALRLARLEREDLIEWARGDQPYPLRPDTTPPTSLTFGRACWKLIHECMV
jgi:hypothetical protein